MTTADKTVLTTLRANIGKARTLDTQIAALKAKLATLTAQRDGIEDEILRTMTAQQIDAVKWRDVTAYVSRTKVGNVKDWAALEAYIARKKAYDLFQRRLHNRAYFDRLEAGEKVPGVEIFERVNVNFRKEQ